MKGRLYRLVISVPLAIAAVIYSIRTEGWTATWAPLKFFIIGVLILVPLFKLLGFF